MIQSWEMTSMPTYQTQLLNEISLGHDGPTIPPAKLAYFQERLRGRIFDFIIGRFLDEEKNGLNQAKLARRIGKRAEVVNRWLGAPSNLTLDTISDLLVGIAAEELTFGSATLLNRAPVNYSHLDEAPTMAERTEEPAQREGASALERLKRQPQQDESNATAIAA
jgi:hypothetical protein